MAERSKRFQSAVVLFALILLVFLVTAIALSFLPQDLTDLEGRGEDQEEAAPVRNLERVLANAASDDLSVTLTEEEINRWLKNQIQGTQEGMLSGNVGYVGTWIRLRDGSVDLIFEREAFQRPHTIAMNIEIEQVMGENNSMNSKIHWKGGRLGQMPVMQGYLALVMKSYRELAKAMAPEVKSLRTLLEGRAAVTISEGKISFSPRSSDSLPRSTGSF